MPIDGKCPRCGFKAPIMCFADAAEHGQHLQAFAHLPQQIQAPYMKYMSLFRPVSGCAMQGSKAVRLTIELVALVTKAFVSEKGKVDRPCYPALWAMGMERMQEQASTLTLPMKSHNYLRAIVYQLADQADARQEQKIRQEESTGATKGRRASDDDMSPEMRRYIAENGDPLLKSSAVGGVNAMLQKMRDRQGGLDAAE